MSAALSPTKVIEASGMLTGLLGASLIALDLQMAALGFAAYLLSNLCWMVWALRSQAWFLLAMQIGFTWASLTGLNRNFGQLFALLG